MYLNLILLAILGASVAMLIREGFWSNTITLFNTVTAGLISTSTWELLATFLDEHMPDYTYFWDFISLWGIFIVSFVILRAITDLLSRIRVRFKMPVELIGGGVMAGAVGWVLVCFATMTLHTAPLARNYLAGNFQPTPDARMFFGLAPDQKWLGLVQSLSNNSLSATGPGGSGVNTFDPEGDFILKYAERRSNLENNPAFSAGG
ncbi:MAG: CvpA family protein [Pirellulales bacterium]